VSSGIVESSKSSEDAKRGTPTAPGDGSRDPRSNRSALVQRLLEASSNLPAFINDLLTTQAVTVAGTEAAAFLLEQQQGGDAEGGNAGGGAAGGGGTTVTMRPIAHIRPDQSSAETRAAALAAFQDLIKPCVQQNRDGAIELGAPQDGGESQFCLVTLLRNEGNVVAASAVITRCLDVARARQRLQSMQLVAGYFDLYTLRRNSDQARMIAQSHQHVLQLATSVATAEGFESAAMNLCNELATRANATRVSLGWVKGKTIKVKALSHTEQFDKKQELVVLLSKVMEECMDQEAVVQYDPTPGGKSTDNVTRNAQQLSRTQGGHIVLSLPLRRKSDVIGVVTLEFLPTVRIGPHVANGLAIAVDLLAPQLYDRYTNDRWLITKAGISTREVAKATIGPKHMLAKLVATLIIGLVLFSVLYKPMYKVTAPFQFVPVAKSTLAAGLDGKIGRPAIMTADGKLLPPDHHDSLLPGERFIRPGDPVKARDVLMKLDTQALEAERSKALAAMARAEAEAQQYRNDPDPKSVSLVLQKEFEAAGHKAEVDGLTLEIEAAKVVAPIDGILLKGDWVDKIGERVRMGDVLMEVGAPGTLEAELYVDERDIQDVTVNQKGKLVTTSLPDDTYDFVVRRIVPVGEPKEGSNVFKVYATIDGRSSKSWRPGMAGEAKVYVRHEPVWWIYSHRLVDFIKLKLWL